jgi:small subunit ribosomal protein S4
MGDAKKLTKHYNTPRHPWQKARIETEKKYIAEFGLKNKREVYKHDTQIKAIIRFFKQLNYQTSAQATKEKEQLLSRVKRLGFLAENKEDTEVLNMTVVNALERRLQTLLFKKGMARSVRQARQFITHQHVQVNGKIVDAPGYIVPVSEESSISFVVRSPLIDEAHPERAMKEEGEEPVVEAPNAKAVEEAEVAAKAEEQVEEKVKEAEPVEITEEGAKE